MGISRITDINYGISKNKEIFKKVKEFYKIRSKIVHNGEYKELNKTGLLAIAEFCRKAIQKYHYNVDVSDKGFIDTLTASAFGSNPFGNKIK